MRKQLNAKWVKESAFVIWAMGWNFGVDVYFAFQLCWIYLQRRFIKFELIWRKCLDRVLVSILNALER
jgi:hypothetical protein